MTGQKLYDIVLMDGFMPIKTGWEATEEIRARELSQGIEPGKGVIIVGVTGATTTEDAASCLRSGMTDVVAKPVDRKALRAKIKKWCPQTPVASTTQTSSFSPSASMDQSVEKRKDRALCIGEGAETLRCLLASEGGFSSEAFEFVSAEMLLDEGLDGLRCGEFDTVLLDVMLDEKKVRPCVCVGVREHAWCVSCWWLRR